MHIKVKEDDRSLDGSFGVTSAGATLVAVEVRAREGPAGDFRSRGTQTTCARFGTSWCT